MTTRSKIDWALQGSEFVNKCGEILEIHLLSNWTRQINSMVFSISCCNHLAKLHTKDNHKIQLQMTENTQSSTLLDPRVRCDVGQVPKTVLSIQALIIVQFHLKLYSVFLSCATLTHIIQPKGPRAESARAVTGRRNSYMWEGGRLFEPSARFFYGNSCNSGTESRKIVSKVGN